jgi:hypothetical protein
MGMKTDSTRQEAEEVRPHAYDQLVRARLIHLQCIDELEHFNLSDEQKKDAQRRVEVAIKVAHELEVSLRRIDEALDPRSASRASSP